MISHIAAVNDEVLKQCLSSLTYFSDKLLLLRAIGRPASDMAGGMHLLHLTFFSGDIRRRN